MKTSRYLEVSFNTDYNVQDSELDLKSNLFADFCPHRYRKWNIGKTDEHEDGDSMYRKLVWCRAN